LEQLSEGLPLQNEKMATPFRNNIRSEKCGTSALGDKSKINLSPLLIKFSLIEISVKAMEK